MTEEPLEPKAEIPEADECDEETYDKYLLAEVMLPKGEGIATGPVIQHKCDHDGNPTRRQNTNPILDAHLYDVQFADGHVEEITTNVIAESLYSQIDNEGNQYLIIQEIADHKKNGSVLAHDVM